MISKTKLSVVRPGQSPPRIECIRHGEWYSDYNCPKCKDQGAIICELVQSNRVQHSKSIRDGVFRRVDK